MTPEEQYRETQAFRHEGWEGFIEPAEDQQSRLGRELCFAGQWLDYPEDARPHDLSGLAHIHIVRGHMIRHFKADKS